MIENVPSYEGLQAHVEQQENALRPVRLLRDSTRFNMMTVLNDLSRRQALFAYVGSRGGLATYNMDIEELDEEGLNQDAWFDVQAGDPFSKGGMRPRDAHTAFARHQDIARAVEDPNVKEMVEEYVWSLSADWSHLFPESGYAILDGEFDPPNPDIETVARFFDLLNGSARNENKVEHVLDIMRAVQEKIESAYVHEWNEGDVVLYDDRALLHTRLHDGQAAPDECPFDNNSTWHIDDAHQENHFALMRLPESDQLVKLQHLPRLPRV